MFELSAIKSIILLLELWYMNNVINWKTVVKSIHILKLCLILNKIIVIDLEFKKVDTKKCCKKQIKYRTMILLILKKLIVNLRM